jgi:thiamine-phosphate pyrophosphorylase
VTVESRRRLGDRSLYLCTPDRADLAHFLERCISGGVDVVQLRDKTLEARPLLERARIARRVCHEHGVPFILNDRPDLALECEADGVHVGQEDAPVQLARRIVGAERIVGLSTHSQDELAAALLQDVDYVSAGPVTPTPTKPGRPGTGSEYIAFASDAVANSRRPDLPVFVTGGVNPETIPDMERAGARRFVVVRYLTESDDPEGAARRLKTSIERCRVGEIVQ